MKSGILDCAYGHPCHHSVTVTRNEHRYTLALLLNVGRACMAVPDVSYSPDFVFLSSEEDYLI